MKLVSGMADFGGNNNGYYNSDQSFAEILAKNSSPFTTTTTASYLNNNDSSSSSSKYVKSYLDDLSGISSSAASNANPSSSTSPGAQVESPEDSEIFSDIVLSYISQMLMEEDIDGKFVYPEDPALLAAEKPFSDILGTKFPQLHDQLPLYSKYGSDGFDDSILSRHPSSEGSTVANELLVGSSWPYDPVEYQQLQINPVHVDYSFSSQSYLPSSNSVSNVVDVFDTLSVSELLMQSQPAELLIPSQPAEQFQKGLEDARKFLPSDDKLVIDLEAYGFYVPQDVKKDVELVGSVKKEKDEQREKNSRASPPVSESRGRKNRHDEGLDLLEGRSNKQSAFASEEPTASQMFDDVLLCNGDKCASSIDQLRTQLQNEANRSSHISHSRSSGGRKGGRGKKQSKKEVVDLRTILIHCAQSVAADDRRSANELLKQIRQHSNPHGDATQRLAHCFADGIEARLAGTGSQIYHSLIAKRIAVTDILKAYQLYMAACPFKKVSHFFSNQTILDVSKNATSLHIVDFGVYYGFQWPCFMQRLSSRSGGPPKLRITGIDNPMPGFRPTELIDETGRRLTDYAHKFGIQFEYKAIAAKWETITVEDLNIDPDEVLIVNCIFRFKGLLDETVVVDSPRNMVLNTIKKLKPSVFIHGILNGSYNAPFFVTRFREALFHYSALFDMIETNVAREDESRTLIERIIFGREALNVIACEGSERIERPETYKQWQVRNLRAGFTQLPLNKEIVKKAKDKVKACYHKDFVVDEDSRWLLQGWKGRIIYALSTWKPNNSS